ncbi:hypothetical protein DXV75_16215 [Alteromonas aestuariivivens]|uniref:Uncharacterized protein n=1 Tax=Alteromonas aestuariivivens TaxID=1938339 RepID=A0A3D8M2R7_9ALTE|nr:hypothetical protein [Alteromonas aestuariivivens]RDV24003.1 hypothetical protein DXV75_16215 [Alteromonas aestuariivivens]
MNDWLNAVGFGIGLVAFALGLSSIIMGFMSGKKGGEGMQEKIEYGFFGVSGLIVCVLMGYALA